MNHYLRSGMNILLGIFLVIQLPETVVASGVSGNGMNSGFERSPTTSGVRTDSECILSDANECTTSLEAREGQIANIELLQKQRDMKVGGAAQQTQYQYTLGLAGSNVCPDGYFQISWEENTEDCDDAAASLGLFSRVKLQGKKWCPEGRHGGCFEKGHSVYFNNGCAGRESVNTDEKLVCRSPVPVPAPAPIQPAPAQTRPKVAYTTLCPDYATDCGNTYETTASVGDDCRGPCSEYKGGWWCNTYDVITYGDGGERRKWGWCEQE